MGITHWFGLRGARGIALPPVRPDYNGGSILNLVATIQSACGSEASGRAQPCRALSAERLSKAPKIVLLVIDGLGADFLERRGGGSVIDQCCVGSLTSVFPSTTASAITTLLTGLPPAIHALTGWHVYFEELDDCLACLPLTSRAPRAVPWAAADLPGQLFSHRGMFRDLARRSVVISPHAIANSPFNRFHTEGAELRGFDSMAEMFEHISEVLDDTAGPSFTYAYYATFDALAHRYGSTSDAVGRCYDRLDEELGRLIERSDAAVRCLSSRRTTVSSIHLWIAWWTWMITRRSPRCSRDRFAASGASPTVTSGTDFEERSRHT